MTDLTREEIIDLTEEFNESEENRYPVSVNENECLWVEGPEKLWNTSCRDKFVLDWGTPTDNGAKFCLFCGKNIKD